MKIIHRAGYKIILISTLLLAAPVLFITLLFPHHLFLSLAFILTALILWVLILRFFRIPVRNFESGTDIVVAPADGRVVVVERTKETEYYNKDMIQVSIFMSIYNVHINWIPYRGKIIYQKYHPGNYMVARHPKSSILNEHNSAVISDGQQSIMVKQIAGYVARRILTFIKEGDQVDYGTELGFIRFGSRLDLLLPIDAEICVKPGEKVKGGCSRIAILKK